MGPNVVGHLVFVGGKMTMVSRKPSYPVVKYVTKEEFDRNTQSISSKFYVCEKIDEVIIYYIKKARQ